MILAESQFAHAVIAWHRKHGRRNLPWQNRNDPYRRWVSEIMLQQTQVTTVIPYYRRFIERFPDLKALATSSIDEVLTYWTGLGYYARARNLHRTARLIIEEHDMEFPGTFEDLVKLPGIGRSTAGAILSFSFNLPYPILDGNVRRVLARYHKIDGWPGKSAIAKRLWAVAELHTPSQNIGEYTQAMMDIGAELCLRRRPLCTKCPLASSCAARHLGDPQRYPTPRPRKGRQFIVTTMIMAHDTDGRVLLEKRPTTGYWGGLWSFPESPSGVAKEDWFQEKFSLAIACEAPWRSIKHQFSHLEIEIQPVPATLVGRAPKLERDDCVWYKPGSCLKGGVAAPIQRFLKRLEDHPI